MILPSVVCFVVLPLALRTFSFWAALPLACAATAAAYAGWVWLAHRIGLNL